MRLSKGKEREVSLRCAMEREAEKWRYRMIDVFTDALCDRRSQYVFENLSRGEQNRVIGWEDDGDGWYDGHSIDFGDVESAAIEFESGLTEETLQSAECAWYEKQLTDPKGCYHLWGGLPAATVESCSLQPLVMRLHMVLHGEGRYATYYTPEALAREMAREKAELQEAHERETEIVNRHIGGLLEAVTRNGELLADIGSDAHAAALNSAQTKRNIDEEIDRRARIKARQIQGGRDGVSRRGKCDNAARNENILREVTRRVKDGEKLENIFPGIAPKYGLTAGGVKSIYYRKRHSG